MTTVIAAIALLFGAVLPAKAQPGPVTLTLRNHQFAPARIEVPAGQRVELHVINADDSAEEFESADLHRERVIPARQEVVIYVGPLKPGSYDFIGEFNPQTARGQIVAK